MATLNYTKTNKIAPENYVNIKIPFKTKNQNQTMDNLNELKFLVQCVESKDLKRALTIIETVETSIRQNITSAETGKLFDKI